ncbi:Uncharacterized protein APZ42_009618 [Daphnia magna]|uniref:Uncharacterized protein n=1 Tax=Daphnia magna TaxID=35525 RepID=A0A164DWS0_9CRUS|nr:Uncharacterized protein APZ42_009618 [Daphnia magna]
MQLKIHGISGKISRRDVRFSSHPLSKATRNETADGTADIPLKILRS